ncbi:MAG: sigma-70 family RNA polymerase sigma factor [Lachnospiraceae bacterium]|nr:sigma-70 family RNA polymerase sigma factor [Lachnospiraceae bacterium]
MDYERFTTLIEQYTPNMYRLSYGILRSRADAEDAVSEAALKAWENLDRLKNPESFKAWIMQITANEARKLYRHAQRVSCAESLEERESVSFEDERHALWDAVMKLDEGYRAVIILYFYERLSIKEIGKALHIAEGTVKSRLSRGKRLLKEMLS